MTGERSGEGRPSTRGRRFALILLLAMSSGVRPSPSAAADVLAAADGPPAGEAAPLGNRVFLEVLGAGLLYSLNYEITLSDRAGVRLGVGGLPFSDASYIVGLAMPTVLVGRGAHKAVLAAGLGFGWESVSLFETEDVFEVYGIASVGYQFQPHPRGFFGRLSFTPIITDQVFSPWGGVSVGKAF
jgi:hypothetical protein